MMTIKPEQPQQPQHSELQAQLKTREPRRKHSKQTRYLSQAIQLEEAVNPHILQSTIGMVALVIAAFLSWSYFTNINEIARASGEVVPQGHHKTVQHFEGGIIKDIHISENMIVQEGSLLLSLDDASLREDLERTRIKQSTLEIQAERLRAFLENRMPDFSAHQDYARFDLNEQLQFFETMREAREHEESIIKKQIAEKVQFAGALENEIRALQSNLAITQNIYNRRKALNERGYASDMQLLDDQRAVNQMNGDINRLRNQIAQTKAEQSQFEERLKSLSAAHRDAVTEKLAAIISEKAQNKTTIEKILERMERLDIRSPANGLVKGLRVHTIGGVVQPGEALMEIIPVDETLEVSIKISPQDVRHIKAGQNVHIKFSTYDFSRFGFVKGTLAQISASTFAGDNGERYYQGRVQLDQSHVGSNTDHRILPGMTVMADIVTSEKTIFQYLLKPIHLSIQTAFSER
jgi:HlyD family secretion protein/adhesin transport system membrane fusion protein